MPQPDTVHLLNALRNMHPARKVLSVLVVFYLLFTVAYPVDASLRWWRGVSDHQPQQGKAPTSTWRAGGAIRNIITWEGDTRLWTHIIVELYDTQRVRLEVVEPALLPDAVEVATAQTSQSDFWSAGLALTSLPCKLIRL